MMELLFGIVPLNHIKTESLQLFYTLKLNFSSSYFLVLMQDGYDKSVLSMDLYYLSFY